MLERLCVPPLSYNTYQSLLDGKVDVSVFLTMNVPKAMYDSDYKAGIDTYFAPMHFLNGEIEIIPVCDTLQANDYSKYDMGSFSEEHKKEVRENEFPAALEKAFEVGQR